MPDGTHCPACGNDIGFWPVARGLFAIRCPHCRERLHHRLDDRMARITTAMAMGAVFVAGALALLVGFVLVQSVNVVLALVVAVGVWGLVALGIGQVYQIAATPFLRRTQRLVTEGERETPVEEESW